jgi:hypothetical protein
MPVGYRLRRALAELQPSAAPGAAGPTVVRVFIGETELRGIVRSEVKTVDDATARTLLAATRAS